MDVSEDLGTSRILTARCAAGAALDAKALSESAKEDLEQPARAPSVLNSWPRAIVAALAARGVDGVELAIRAGIDRTALEDASARAPVTATGRLWRLAVEATGDPCFGLFASRFLSFPAFPALGVAILASSSVRDAFVRVVRYSRIVSDAAEYRLEDAGERCFLHVGIGPDAHLEDESVDAIVSLNVRTLRALLGDRRHGPLSVALTRPRPEPSEAFARFFRAPVEFGAPGNVLAFDRALIDARLPAAHAELALRSDEVMAKQLAADGRGDLRAAVEGLVRERLAAGEPGLEDVAASLGMSRRTLQRRLADSGTDFAAVLDDVRRQAAMALLREGRWSVTEIAFSLGFREASSFSRAFRRWTGQSPAGFRG